MSSNYLVKNGLAIIQLSNPPFNSLSLKLRDSILRCIERATSIDKVSGVVITNSGPWFSNGYDLIETVKGNLHQKPSINDINACIESHSNSIPFLAAFNGNTFGAGLEVGLSCHYRIATSSSQFGFVDSDIGLSPGKYFFCLHLI
jgi:3-hydroxyacyl-CoA dehydrogenase